ncbi:hypothetical protein OLX02_13475 [Novosphingobium sp. KCTC 2891]|uniref:hypothetical protein n=1 Tax=Novosphingobium sp. KCTC 2891 TaxID=2989730 RepID=UPI0022214FE2|nr:hypothetical protein [Novosphingobium sp. KCTC 2891]MCW1383831.1 hypothetical protein [Novosphingobium sp. KCTC 2891]
MTFQEWMTGLGMAMASAGTLGIDPAVLAALVQSAQNQAQPDSSTTPATSGSPRHSLRWT